MATDIRQFFDKEYRDILKNAPAKSQKIRLKSLVYTDEFEKHGVKRKSFYTNFYSTFKKNMSSVLSVSEREYSGDNRKNLLSNDNKDGIVQAMLAMRNKLFEKAQYSNMEKAYKAGYDVPQKALGIEFDKNDVIDNTTVVKLKEEFMSDVDRFIYDLAERIDKIVDENDEKKKKNGWKWVALSAALFAAVDAMEYRLGYIAIEPFRLAFRTGAMHGILKGTKKKDLKIQKFIWETTSTKPCENCLALDGTEVTKQQAERFLHPNCHCTLTLIVR